MTDKNKSRSPSKPQILSSFRSKTGYRVSKVSDASVKRARSSLKKNVELKKLSKPERNAIIDSIKDQSFSKSFLNNGYQN